MFCTNLAMIKAFSLCDFCLKTPEGKKAQFIFDEYYSFLCIKYSFSSLFMNKGVKYSTKNIYRKIKYRKIKAFLY